MLRALLRSSGYSCLFTCLLTMMGVGGCTTPKGQVKSQEILRSLNEMHLAVKSSLNGAIKKRSQNTRTYTSRYHIPGMDLNALATKKKERGQVVMSILGDRRPYRVVVLYRIEKRNGRKYKLDRYDKSLAQQYLKRVTEYLASRPEDRDMIDEFRPY